MKYSWGVLQAALVDQQIVSPFDVGFYRLLNRDLHLSSGSSQCEDDSRNGSQEKRAARRCASWTWWNPQWVFDKSLGGLFVTTGIIEGIGTRYNSDYSMFLIMAANHPCLV